MDRLIVKNFGPLKDIDIELNKVNLFIGENGSGKSVLGKLITILYNVFDNMNSTKEDIIKYFEDYRINYLSKDTVIELNEVYDNNKKYNIIKIKDLEFEFGNIIDDLKRGYSGLKDSEELIENKKNKQIDIIREKIDEINKLKELDVKNQKLLEFENDLKKLLSTIQNESQSLLNETSSLISTINKLQSKYIPSERNFISIISKSLSSFIVADIPLPKYLIQFASDFENGANKIKELDILNVKYSYSDGLDRHKIYFDDNNYLPLNESSSGIQAVIPLLITYKYFTQKYHTIVIEEPEQNLFPKAQKETVEFIIENFNENNQLFIMTHSPYILSSLNILMMAYKAGNMSNNAKKEVEKIIPESKWINSDDFSAYFIENGKAKNIKGKTGLISENIIDDISDDIQDEFENLLSIYREYKNAH